MPLLNIGLLLKFLHFKYYMKQLKSTSSNIFQQSQEKQDDDKGLLEINETQQLEENNEKLITTTKELSEEELKKIFSYENFLQMHLDLIEIKTAINKQC